MTREDAINLLSQVNHILVNSNSWLENTHEPLNIAFDMAIKALEQEPCEDAVSRKAVVEYIKASDAELGHNSENETVVGDILTMPSVKPVACIAKVKFSKEDMQELVNEKMKDIVVERKKGHWEQYGDSWKEKYRCSECKEEQPKMLCGEQIIGFWSDYCPNCGAEMDGEE